MKETNRNTFGILSPDSAGISLAPTTNHLATWETRELSKKSERILVHDENCAILAAMALQHATSLTTFEMYCNSVAPSGAHRYAYIVNSYVQRAAERIGGC